MAERGEPLSEREQAVLERLAEGLTNREIAQVLEISPNTVKVHVRNIFAKLDVSSRTEATTAAIQKGLLVVPGTEPPPEPGEPVEGLAEAESDQGEPDAETAVAEQPAEELVAGEAAAEDSLAGDSPGPTITRHWRIFVFLVILVVGLLIGALATAWLLGNGAEPTPTATGESEDEFVPQPVGDSKWRTGRPLPTERADMAVASIGLDLYVIGGQVEAGVVNLVDVYETDSQQWLSAAAKPTAVSDTSAAVLFGEIFVPGGRLVDGTPTAVVEAYSPANNAWRPVAPLPSPVAGGLALSDGSKLYLIGGWDGERYLDGGFVYDPAADVWQALPPMVHARAQAAGDLLGDRLFVVGGFDGERALAVCEYFDVPENTWFACADMALGRSGAGASAQGNDSLYIIGGGEEGALPGGELYNLPDDSWSPIETPMVADDGSWHDLGVVAVETHIYALGGRQGGSIVADNFTYIPLVPRTYLPSVGSEG